MAKRFTDTNKYKKPFIRGLPGAYKLFWDYLYHDCDHAGIWIVDFQIAQIYVGIDMPINRETALELYNKDEVRVVEFCTGKKWFLPDFLEFQYGELSESNRAHKSVLNLLEKHKLTGAVKPLISPLQGCKDKDMDKDKDKDKDKERKRSQKFTPPAVSDVAEYITTEKYKVNPQVFCDFYASKGWLVGKNKMKDWKAAVRTWHAKDNPAKATKEKCYFCKQVKSLEVLKKTTAVGITVPVHICESCITEGRHRR